MQITPCEHLLPVAGVGEQRIDYSIPSYVRVPFSQRFVLGSVAITIRCSLFLWTRISSKKIFLSLLYIPPYALLWILSLSGFILCLRNNMCTRAGGITLMIWGWLCIMNYRMHLCKKIYCTYTTNRLGY